MTFDSSESGVQTNEPIFLYTFNFILESFYLTNHDEDLVFGGVPYEHVAITHTSPAATKEEEAASVEVTLPSDHPIAAKYADNVPGKHVVVEIVKTHLDEIGGAEDHAEVFEGFVASTRFEGALGFVLKLRAIADIFRSVGPRYQYTGLCNHTLYDVRCKVNRASFQYDGLVTAVSGSTITVNGASGLGADFFDAGFAEAPAGSAEDYRLIMKQTGDDMRLLRPFAANPLNKTVRLFAGCKHDLTTCNTKFANVINFGGFPWIPTKNPFESELR